MPCLLDESDPEILKEGQDCDTPVLDANIVIEARSNFQKRKSVCAVRDKDDTPVFQFWKYTCHIAKAS